MPPDIPAQFNAAAHFLDRHAQECPERIAIVGEPAEVNYGELARLANRVGNALSASGCRPGDRVLIALPDSVEFVAAFFGCTKMGGVAVPVNSMARGADYAYYLADCGARVAVVHSSNLTEFLPVFERGGLARMVVVGWERGVRGDQTLSGGMLSWDDWLEQASERLEPHRSKSTDTAFFLYTSGSGGQPKGAVHQHQDMLVASRAFAGDVLGLRPDDLTFSVSKLFFPYGFGNGMYFPFSVGARTLLHPERPKVDRVVELVRRYRPTVFFAVPTFYAGLLREVRSGLAADFSSVRLAVSAGETLPAEIFEQFRKRFGIEILDGIGSTEMLHIFVSSRPGWARPGSCGSEVPGYRAKIVDEEGKPVRDGEIGNLWVSGASAFSGYWKKPELTARTKQGEWVVTGDKFIRDRDGYYHYCGRSDDMMKVAGMWVAPAEVENALLGHPQVAEAAVVGVCDATGLTRPVAHVVLRAGASGSAQLEREIREFVHQRLPGYKCPQEVHFAAELPKTATGKIQRFKLRGSGGG